jgi:hypothetical protein
MLWPYSYPTVIYLTGSELSNQICEYLRLGAANSIFTGGKSVAYTVDIFFSWGYPPNPRVAFGVA